MANRNTSFWACAAIALTTPAAVAGPNWDEVCDAGSTIGGAQIIPGGMVRSIKGKLGPCGIAGPGDMEDVYQITITTPVSFCARTMLLTDHTDCCGNQVNPTQGTNFDTQLFLFGADGRGLLANDNETIAGPPPGLSRLPNASNDGTGIVLTVPGTYYIAISGGPNRDPVSSTGIIFNMAPSSIEVSGPDGPGGANPLTGWVGTGATGPTVLYEIWLCGSVPGVPAASTSWVVLMTGMMLVGGAIMILRGRVNPAA